MYSKQVLKHFKRPHNQGKMEKPSFAGTAGSPVCGDTLKVYLKVSAKGGSASGGQSCGKVDWNKKRNRGKKSPHSAIAQGRLLIPLYERGKHKIEDIKFETLGCAAAIASSSVLTDMAKGKSLDAAMKITKEAVVKKLGGLPLHKEHC